MQWGEVLVPLIKKTWVLKGLCGDGRQNGLTTRKVWGGDFTSVFEGSPGLGAGGVKVWHQNL